MEKAHSNLLQDIPPSQFLFNMRNKKTSNYGQCVICKNKTTFNLVTKKYNRLCSNPVCKDKYVEIFKSRMKRKYGSEHLLNDPDKQKQMLANRRISGVYTYGKRKIVYTGDYELDFLMFLHKILHFPEEDIIAPAPMTFKYKYGGVNHFYIPDFYFPSMHLLIEIKSAENKHYRLRDINQEKVKDKLALNSGFNYLKIFDKDYTEFLEKIEDGQFLKPKKSSEKVLNESLKKFKTATELGDVLLESRQTQEKFIAEILEK